MRHLFPVPSKPTGCCADLLVEAWKGWKTAAGFVAAEGGSMTQCPPLWVQKWDGGSAAEAEAWSNTGEQQRERRTREEQVAVSGKVFWLGQAETVDGDDDDGGADAVVDDGKDGDDAPVTAHCHTACFQGIQTGFEAPHQPLSVPAWASGWPGSAEAGPAAAAAAEHPPITQRLWQPRPWKRTSRFYPSSLCHRRSVCELQVGGQPFLRATLPQAQPLARGQVWRSVEEGTELPETETWVQRLHCPGKDKHKLKLILKSI